MACIIDTEEEILELHRPLEYQDSLKMMYLMHQEAQALHPSGEEGIDVFVWNLFWQHSDDKAVHASIHECEPLMVIAAKDVPRRASSSSTGRRHGPASEVLLKK